ncbi:SDR family NAD(P)-dependent oxidoreductase [Vibrio profundum]|uniref:SDR family NAD(P)-dependent oxidoreductase n=1 Tax=Vibrio profundum TaxID=2910247 RepID=UPI003D11FD63
MNNHFVTQYGPWGVITGATSGIGAALADQVAEKGVNLFLVSRSEQSLQKKADELQQAYGVEVKIIPADLTIAEDCEKIITATSDSDIGLFIPCAGVETHGTAIELDLKHELDMIQINVASVFRLGHHFSNVLAKRNKGGIMFVSSLYGLMPAPYFANYGGTKAYVTNLGLAMHWEMKKHGVDVMVLAPGPTDTPMIDSVANDYDLSKVPLSVISPEAVAKEALEGLGCKALVVPSKKNKIMFFMTKHFSSVLGAVKFGGKMMEKAMKK